MHRELCGVLEVMLDERLVYRGTGSSTVIAKQREGRKRACSTTENGSESLREHPGVIHPFLTSYHYHLLLAPNNNSTFPIRSHHPWLIRTPLCIGNDP